MQKPGNPTSSSMGSNASELASNSSKVGLNSTLRRAPTSPTSRSMTSVTRRKKIYEYGFVIRLIPEISEPVLRDIFQRLNRNNVALNQQELRQATYWGPFIQSMNRIADADHWEGTGLFTANDIRRMLDVEFISELAVGFLHGLQNKKQSLDRWYIAYEGEFEQQARLESVFDKVMGELGQILPDMSKTRWRKKSDFYTLFLVFAAHATSIPLSSNQRQSASERLHAFEFQVTQYLNEFTSRTVITEQEEPPADPPALTEGSPENTINVVATTTYPNEVVQYAAGVHRASSDLSNRRKRAQQVEAILRDTWSSGSPDNSLSGSRSDERLERRAGRS